MPRKGLLFLLLLFATYSCKDQIDFSFPEPLTYKYVAHYNASPILEFLFTQRLGEKKGENITTLKIKNIRNTDLENLKFVVSVFKSQERTNDNFEFFYASDIQSKIAAGDTSNTITINNSSNLILKDGLVEVGLISVGRDNKFSNTYQGSFKAYSSIEATPSNLVAYNITNCYITSDGFVNVKLAGSTTTKRIQGYIDAEGDFYGEAMRADGTIISKMINTEKATITDDILNLKIDLLGSTNPDNIDFIVLSLSGI